MASVNVNVNDHDYAPEEALRTATTVGSEEDCGRESGPEHRDSDSPRATESGLPHPRKKQRILRACDSCHVRRVKCDVCMISC